MLRNFRLKNESVRVHNRTRLVLVLVVSGCFGPLYKCLLQPDERRTFITGRLPFHVSTFPYDGTNLPTDGDVALGIIIPTLGAIAIAASAGIAGAAATAAAAPVAGTAQTIFAASAAPAWAAGVDAGVAAAFTTGGAVGTIAGLASRCAGNPSHYNKVEKRNHYANGDWIHVVGGPDEARPMSFEY